MKKIPGFINTKTKTVFFDLALYEYFKTLTGFARKSSCYCLGHRGCPALVTPLCFALAGVALSVDLSALESDLSQFL